MPIPKRNAFYAQSGGVTAVINASAAGVIQTARRHRSRIGKVYAGRNGIIGALTEDLIDTSKESARAIAALKDTPAGAFGSCRYKLKGLEEIARAVRAPDRRVPRARHRLLLLQRRQRFRRHLPEGRADRGKARLSNRRASTCPRRWTTICRLPTTRPGSARLRSMSRRRCARRRSTSRRWRRRRPRCSSSR